MDNVSFIMFVLGMVNIALLGIYRDRLFALPGRLVLVLLFFGFSVGLWAGFMIGSLIQIIKSIGPVSPF